MKKILNFLKNPWLIGITGFLAVGALIWYLGPLISVAGNSPLATDMGRIATIIAFGGSMAIYKIVYYIQTLRSNRDMLADLAGQVGQPGAGGAGSADDSAAREKQQKQKEQEAASAEEISTLKQGLDEALGVLKKTRLGGKTGRGQYLYQLPWYIIIAVSYTHLTLPTNREV